MPERLPHFLSCLEAQGPCVINERKGETAPASRERRDDTWIISKGINHVQVGAAKAQRWERVWVLREQYPAQRVRGREMDGRMWKEAGLSLSAKKSHQRLWNKEAL